MVFAAYCLYDPFCSILFKTACQAFFHFMPFKDLPSWYNLYTLHLSDSCTSPLPQKFPFLNSVVYLFSLCLQQIFHVTPSRYGMSFGSVLNCLSPPPSEGEFANLPCVGLTESMKKQAEFLICIHFEKLFCAVTHDIPSPS